MEGSQYVEESHIGIGNGLGFASRDIGSKHKAIFREFTSRVTDGRLDIEFPHKKGGTPMLNAIEVIRTQYLKERVQT